MLFDVSSVHLRVFLCTAARNASRVLAIVGVSVCLSLCLSVTLLSPYQNGASLNYEIFTVGCLKNSSL